MNGNWVIFTRVKVKMIDICNIITITTERDWLR